MKNKIKIIDEIVKRHPMYGVKNGWSCYVGGMMDTGNWYFRKMLDVPIRELKLFLDNIIKEENAPPKIHTEIEIADMKVVHKLPNGGFITEHYKKQLEAFQRGLEKLIWTQPTQTK